MSRPVGLSGGAVGLLFAWLGGAAIARLTGATPVVLVLAAGVVLFAFAAVGGAITLRGTSVHSVLMPPSSTQGDPIAVEIAVRAPRPVWVDIRVGRRSVAAGWTHDSTWNGEATMSQRGVVEQVEVRVRSAGGLGLCWWSRRFVPAITPHLVAARPHQRAVTVDRSSVATDGEMAGAAGSIAGEIDGVRPWREGDSEKSVHWASSLRSGELVVHDRRRDSDARWRVRARSGTSDPDEEAGAVRWMLEQGLRAGARMEVATDGADPVAIADADAAARWSAVASLGEPTEPPADSWWNRRVAPEPESTAALAARWWAAGATFVSLTMLMGALGHGPTAMIVLAVIVAGGALVSGRSLVTGEQPSPTTRAVIALGAVAGLAMVVASSGRVDGLLTFLRGPLPQVLVVLILLHGFECRDRRTIRVSLGISAVVVMYAGSFRVDDTVGWWLLVWAACFGLALAEVARPAGVQRALASVCGRARTVVPHGRRDRCRRRGDGRAARRRSCPCTGRRDSACRRSSRTHSRSGSRGRSSALTDRSATATRVTRVADAHRSDKSAATPGLPDRWTPRRAGRSATTS